ncbi:MAG: hypothetical protein IJD90_04215, partial [Clostridia bacterium]|nr:hypothetical protein [Clostridia bacterium]
MKKVLAVLLALLFCISFVGCDGEKEEVAPTTTQIKNSTTTNLITEADTSTTTTCKPTTTVKKQTTTKVEDIDVTRIERYPMLSIDFKNNERMVKFFKENKTKKSVLKAGGKNKNDWDYSALLNSLENSKMIFEEKVVFSIKSSLYNLKEIYFDGREKYFVYLFEDSKGMSIPLIMYCYNFLTKSDFEKTNQKFSTVNGYNVFQLDRKLYSFQIYDYPIIVSCDNEKTTKEFIESL